jgi:heat shock protein HtpX
MNVLRTTLLMTVLTVLLVWVGDLVAGRQGMWLFLALAGAMNFFAYWFSDKVVLAMYRARPVSEGQAPELYGIVRGLAQRGNLPMPKVCVVPSESPNAFATGRDPRHAAVAVTQGILRLLGREELEGVLAHELAHVRNRDTLTSAVVATIAGAITMLSRSAMWGMMWGGGRRDDRGGGGGNPIALVLALVLAPLAALLVQTAISRTREFAADRTGAEISGRPLALAAALGKLERGAQAMPMRMANEATAHQFIVNPLRGGLAGLFSTHPSTAERVARLESIARARGQAGPALA